jgi:hypothetical protein
MLVGYRALALYHLAGEASRFAPPDSVEILSLEIDEERSHPSGLP